MPEPIWNNTLEQFRDRVAGLEPAPAGVTAAAVSATFGFGLLTKVLAIASKRKDFAGDRELVRTLLDAAHAQSQIVSQLADEDIAAFDEYLSCLRRKQPSGASIRKPLKCRSTLHARPRPVWGSATSQGSDSRLRRARSWNRRRIALGSGTIYSADGGIQSPAVARKRSLPD